MRAWDDKSFIPFELEALTPIHIGSGEDFSPLGYVVREPAEGKYEAWLIDAAAWLADNADNADMGKALEAGDMAALRGLLNKRPHLEDYILARIAISRELGLELLRKRNSLDSRAEIMAFARNPFTHMPYVPGSSLKGAIRTALIDHLNERRKGGGNLLQAATDGKYNEILKGMLGGIGDNALAALKIGDIALPPGATSIREAIGVGLGSDKTMPKTPCETLDPESVKVRRICGKMLLASSDGAPRIAFPNDPSISAAEIWRLCNAFYKKRFNAEFDKFYTKPHLAVARKLLEPISSRIDGIDEDREMLLRLGRYSHIECVTISGARARKPKGCGNTRTLAGKTLPFGWVILRQCSRDAYLKSIETVDADIRKDMAERAAASLRRRQKSLEAEARAREAEKAKKERELRLRKEEEAKKELELRLAALPPQERAIWELGQPGAAENQASEIYKNLDAFGDLKTKAAEALMRFWKDMGKWEGKQLTKKQKEKVARVRAILKI